MSALIYPAAIEQAGPNDFVVRFRDIPEAITGGVTEAEALSAAGDALAAAVDHYLDLGRDVPAPSVARRGERQVGLEPAVAARLLLVSAMAAHGVSGRALAGLLGKDEKAVRRVVSGKGASLEQTFAALRVLGVRPALSTVTALRR